MKPTPFMTKRRTYGPGSSSRLRCGPSTTGFLVVVAGVWITVLLIFGTALFVQERSTGSGSIGSFRLQKNGNVVRGEETELQKLKRTVQELEERIDEVGRQQGEIPRPGLELKHTIEEAEAEEEKERARQHPLQEQLKKKEQQGNLKKDEQQGKKMEQNSDTSPIPLVDPTVLAREDPPFEHHDMETLCNHRKDGDEDILERIDVWDKAEMGKPRILCFSYTLSKVHDSAVKNVRMTWGKQCDGYLAMSDLTDPHIPSIDIKHKGPEAYDNMWQKVRSIWLYLYKHHMHDFDYFVSGGDDLFLIVENLRRYLLSDEIIRATDHGHKPIFMGRRFKPPKEPLAFNSGGAGIILNSKALEILGKGLSGNSCRPNQRGFWEDVNVAYCLHLHGIHPYNTTRDDFGRERFLPFTPGNHLNYRIPKKHDWYADYVPDLKEGFDCCSTEAVTFHYVKGELMKRYYALTHGLCPNRRKKGDLKEGKEGEVAKQE